MIARILTAVALAVSGAVHAMLYAHGYSHISVVGPAFLTQASVSVALAVLIVAGGPAWLCWLGALLSAGTLVAFGLSRTVGFAGFVERGWSPSPETMISVAAQVVAVCAVGATAWRARAHRQAGARNASSVAA